MNNTVKIKGGTVLSGGVCEKTDVYYSGGKIIAVGGSHPFECEIDATGLYVSAGFIDTHLHGGGGADFLDGGKEPIITAAETHLAHGTTSLLPTTLACSLQTLTSFLSDLKEMMENGEARANIIGAHLEGPYFALSQSGAQNPDYIKAPEKEEYTKIIKEYGGIIKKWSFAPELEGSAEFCKALKKAEIIPSIAHTEATFNDVKEVYNEGVRHFTHLYSSMSTITRKNGERILGVIESAYYFDDVDVEVIADGKHLPPELLKIIIKSKTPNNVCLVTDAMRAAGTDLKESFLGRKGEETPCIIEDGIAKLYDRTSFAGSVATADRLVRTLVKEVGINIADAVKMITEIPARILNLNTKGKVAEGYDADIVIFDENVNVKTVIVNGNLRVF